MEPPFVVGIFAIVSTLLLIGSVILTKHKERMSILEKGMNQADVQAVFGKMYGSRQALSSLKFGILLVMVGLGVLVGGIIDHLYNVNDGFMPGIILLFGGVGLLIFYFIARKSTPKE